jgi:hypothetical protein
LLHDVKFDYSLWSWFYWFFPLVMDWCLTCALSGFSIWCARKLREHPYITLHLDLLVLRNIVRKTWFGTLVLCSCFALRSCVTALYEWASFALFFIQTIEFPRISQLISHRSTGLKKVRLCVLTFIVNHRYLSPWLWVIPIDLVLNYPKCFHLSSKHFSIGVKAPVFWCSEGAF